MIANITCLHSHEPWLFYLVNAYVGSPWLTGQVLRVDGNRVQRPRGWRAAGEDRRRSGGAVEAEELVTGLPEVYGTAPSGRLPDPAIHGA